MSTPNLEVLIRSMRPETRPGEYVFVDATLVAPDITIEAMVREREGRTVVIPRADADRLGLGYDFVGGWITLTLYSSLKTVGLTAAVVGELAQSGIGCNVIAGLHHDHLLVPHDRLDEALTALRRLSGRPSPKKFFPF